jgi:hypothetical protein
MGTTSDGIEFEGVEWRKKKIKARCNCRCNALPGMKGRSFQRQQGLTIGHART